MSELELNGNTNNMILDIKNDADTMKNFENFLFQFLQFYEFYLKDTMKPVTILEYPNNLLFMMNIVLEKSMIENLMKGFDGYSLQCDFGIESVDSDELNRINPDSKICSLNEIGYVHSIFDSNLKTSTLINDNMIIHIIKKYGDYNLDISLPKFTFERFVANFIIWYELFIKGKEKTAKILFSIIYKWLIELDEGSDKFYLSISNGLKYVLLSTFINITKSTTNSTEDLVIFGTFIPYSDLDQVSIAAIHAIQAAVYIEYGHDECYFKQADEYSKLACTLDPINPYWFYLHSLVLRAYRIFLNTNLLGPTENEKNAIQQSIALSDDQNIIYIKYHEILLFKDTVLSEFRNDKLKNIKLLSNYNTIVKMINDLIIVELEDPLILVNCAKILSEFPKRVSNISLEKILLVDGLMMAPNNLAVVKAITKVILCRLNFEKSHSSLITIGTARNLSGSTTQSNLDADLKLAVETHNKGINPVPYLRGLLNDYDIHSQCKIIAQICSYTILINKNLIIGLNYFMMIVEAELQGIETNNLLMCHYSLFTQESTMINLFELINDKINMDLKYQVTDDNYSLSRSSLINYSDDEKSIDSTMEYNSFYDASTAIFEFNINDNQCNVDDIYINRNNSINVNDISINKNDVSINVNDISISKNDVSINENDKCCMCGIM